MGARSARSVVVTGGSGFIGTAVVAEALRQGHSVHALIRECEPPTGVPGVADHVVDWADGAGLRRLLDTLAPDSVIHCAGSSARARESVSAIYEANVALVWTLLDALGDRGGDTGVVILSSAAVYGPDAAPPVAESASLDPRSHYGHSKVVAERVAEGFATLDGVRAVVARPFNVFGPGEPAGSVVGRIAQQFAEAPPEGPVRLALREAVSVRDFVDIEDVARALLHLGTAGAACTAYNVCSGVGVSIADLVTIAAEVTGRTVELALESPDDTGTVSIGSSDRLRDLGWAPVVSLTESVRRILGANGRSDAGGGRTTPGAGGKG